MNNIASIPQILKGIFCAFLAILMIRVVHPINDAILSLWTTSNMMYYTANLIMWIIYIFVLWVLVWAIMLKPKEQIQQGGG